MFAHAILAAALLAQGAAEVQGTVMQAGSGEPVVGATVRVPALDRAAVTDARGAFVIRQVPDGVWEVRASALGHRAHSVRLRVPSRGVVRVQMDLEADPVPLQGVRVSGRMGALASGSSVEAGGASGPSLIRVDASVVAALPALAEPDLFHALQALPSVQAGSDFSSALYVRGGLPDQNLLLLDGAPLFNPFHLGGLFSAFDPAATEWVGLLPGAFPAGVGDRLSSAVDVRTRDGGRDRVRGGGAIGLVSSRASLNGPLPGGRGSFLVSARHTSLDLASEAAHLLGLIPTPLPYGFTDAHAKLTHDLGPGRLSLSGYLDREGLRFRASDWVRDPTDPDERLDLGWGSRMISARYSQPVGPSVGVEVRAGVSHFGGDFGHWRRPRATGLIPSAAGAHNPDSVVATLAARTVQRDVFAGADLTWLRGGHATRAGLQVDAYRFEHDLAARAGEYGEELTPFARADRPWSVAAYAEQEWAATEALSLRGGLRVLAAGPLGTEWLPRAGLRYRLSPALALTLGGGRSAQVMRSLINQESVWSSVLAYDLVGAVPRGSGLSSASDVAAGVEWGRGSTALRVDGYVKRFHDLPLAPIPRTYWSRRSSRRTRCSRGRGGRGGWR